MRGEKRCMNYAGQCLEYPQVRIRSIDAISAGDHLLFRRCGRIGLYDHHVIVIDVDKRRNMLTIANFAGHVAEKTKPQVLITREPFAKVKDCVYKVEYGREAFRTDEVVRRAQQIGRESQYNFFSNNCEHFARYCKVGDRKSVQVKNFKRTAGGVSANVIKDLVKTHLVDKTNKVIPSKVKVGGAVGAGIIEAVLTSDDIYRYYRMLEKGTIDEDEFIELVLKRLLVAITSVAGTELGAAAGFCVAGPVGMVIGGLLGNIFGKLTGRVMGEAVVFGKDTVLALLAQYGNQSYKHD